MYIKPINSKLYFKTLTDKLKSSGIDVNYPYFAMLTDNGPNLQYRALMDKQVSIAIAEKDVKWLWPPHKGIGPRRVSVDDKAIAYSNMPCKKLVQCDDEYCNNMGTCTRVPYSSTLWCKCKKGYVGARCSKKEKIKKIGDVINMMVSIPTLSDVAFGVEDLKNMTSTHFLKTQGLIRAMEKGLKQSIANLQKNIGNQVAFTQLIAKYYSDMSALNHALTIHRQRPKEYFYVSKQAWAKEVLRHGNMGKWLRQYHIMMSGQEKVFGGEPLIVQLMTKSWQGKCDASYKSTIMNAYAIVMATQVRGYLAYTEAQEILKLNNPKFDITKLMKLRKKQQIAAIEARSCKVAIAGTNLEHCSDKKVPFGFIQVGRKLKVSCLNPAQYPLMQTYMCSDKKPGNF